jgi:uncharacterized protein
MDTFTNDREGILYVLAEIFGHYRIGAESKSLEISVLDQRLTLEGAPPSIQYKRYAGETLKAETTIMSDLDPVVIGIFPVPPLFTPASVATRLYLKFKSPIVVDQGSEAVVYAKMPVEIAVFRQSAEEELLIDAFSPARQRYALYGTPESGVVCRFVESITGNTKEEVAPEKYYEALVRIRIRNDIDDIVRVTKVIVPLEGVVLDHAHDESWLPGTVEMALDTLFGKDIVNVRFSNTKVKRPDKTSSAKSEETRNFLMDAGY